MSCDTSKQDKFTPSKLINVDKPTFQSPAKNGHKDSDIEDDQPLKDQSLKGINGKSSFDDDLALFSQRKKSFDDLDSKAYVLGLTSKKTDPDSTKSYGSKSYETEPKSYGLGTKSYDSDLKKYSFDLDSPDFEPTRRPVRFVHLLHYNPKEQL